MSCSRYGCKGRDPFRLMWVQVGVGEDLVDVDNVLLGNWVVGCGERM